jgi:DNA repair ATPase RecN
MTKPAERAYAIFSRLELELETGDLIDPKLVRPLLDEYEDLLIKHAALHKTANEYDDTVQKLRRAYEHNLEVANEMQRMFSVIELDQKRLQQKQKAVDNLMRFLTKPWFPSKGFKNAWAQWEQAKNVDYRFMQADYRGELKKRSEDLFTDIEKAKEGEKNGISK